jgi:hypothetical protein
MVRGTRVPAGTVSASTGAAGGSLGAVEVLFCGTGAAWVVSCGESSCADTKMLPALRKAASKKAAALMCSPDELTN